MQRASSYPQKTKRHLLSLLLEEALLALALADEIQGEARPIHGEFKTAHPLVSDDGGILIGVNVIARAKVARGKAVGTSAFD
jgi:hypothetical protein